MKSLQLVLLVGLALWGSPSARGAPIGLKSFQQKPRLVLVLVVDQFRSDYLTRFHSRFLAARQKGKLGGFSYLMSEGAYYPFAEYGALQNMTCPGHAMILSGASPYQTRISTNVWFDPQLGRSVYCVEDLDFPVIADRKTHYAGLSPRSLKGSTVGDELKSAGFPSQVVTVSLKDRAAIMLGGHRADLALWFEEELFSWTTSRYYRKDGTLPEWVKNLNRDVGSITGQTRSWKSEGQGTGFAGDAVTSSFQQDYTVGKRDSLRYPIGVELTARAAQAALKGMRLGQGSKPGPDLLAVSFSTHDYLGHAKGPSSREMEELTVTEDRWISELLNTVNQTVPGGLASVVVVLTADHGIAHDPAELSRAQVDAGMIDMDAITGRLQTSLSEKFGKPSSNLSAEKWIVYAHDLNLSINRKILAEKGLRVEAVETEIKARLVSESGVGAVVLKSEIEKGVVPRGLIGQQILRSFVTERNGDVIIIPKPNYFQSGDPVSHMTGYSYDRTVPLILAGRSFKPGVYSEKAAINDLAMTLSFILGVIPPSLSEGRVLSETLR